MEIESWVRNEKWVRSQHGWVAGVCQGLGDRFDIDPKLLRVLWILSVFLLGVGLAVYVVLAFTLPREDKISESHKEKFLGVCWELSQRSEIDIGAIRFLAVMLALCSLGTTIIGYLILYFVMPQIKGKEEKKDELMTEKHH